MLLYEETALPSVEGAEIMSVFQLCVLALILTSFAKLGGLLMLYHVNTLLVLFHDLILA